jgi:hypothetical protein
MSNKGDAVVFPAQAEIISAAEGGVRLFVEDIELAEECRELYFERWHPAGYGSKARVERSEGGEGFVVVLSRHSHCE